LLWQIATSEKRSLQDILGQTKHQDSPINTALDRQREQRLKEGQRQLEDDEMELEQLEEDISYIALDEILKGVNVDLVSGLILQDDRRQRLIEDIRELKWQPEELTEDDVRGVLQSYERDGYINIKQKKVLLTSRGAKRLATRALARVLATLKHKKIGTHATEETGFGSVLSQHTRPYEAGDDYATIDIEKTLLSSVRRRGTLLFDLPDLEVHHEIHESKLSVGLLIDKSSSMKNEGKLAAAVETGKNYGFSSSPKR
jgi:hypothetical protein